MNVKGLLLIGTGLAAFAAMPAYTQSQAGDSGAATLEASCRATEVTAPASCPCAITKARAAGLSDTELASLFKDDGHTQPVSEAKYTQFWTVKSQCIMDATLAAMGISSSNPLPGVPANMRPGMPLGGPPAAMPPQPAPASACSSAFSGPDDNVICGQTGTLPTQLILHRSLEQYPQLLSLLKAKANASFAEMGQYSSARERYSYVVAWNAPFVQGRLVSVTGNAGDTSRGRLTDSSKVLWDTQLNREVEWTDVFEQSVWNGTLRDEYCDRLFAIRKEQGEASARVQGDCPQLDRLSPALSRTDDGQTAISFWGATGVVAGYANSAFYDGIKVPLDATLLRCVKPAYREALGAGAESIARAVTAPSAGSLQSRLGPLKSVLAGEIQASDDFYLLPQGRFPLETVAKFDRVLDQDKPTLFMTLYEGTDPNNWGYSVMLDGRKHNLERTDHNADYTVLTYSDGVVSVRIAKGKSVSNNPAFGYSVDTVTITKGSESETFKAINFGGA